MGFPPAAPAFRRSILALSSAMDDELQCSSQGIFIPLFLRRLTMRGSQPLRVLPSDSSPMGLKSLTGSHTAIRRIISAGLNAEQRFMYDYARMTYFIEGRLDPPLRARNGLDPFGDPPDRVTLAKARLLAGEARAQLRAGLDPIAERQIDRRANRRKDAQASARTSEPRQLRWSKAKRPDGEAPNTRHNGWLRSRRMLPGDWRYARRGDRH
jgi:hypothetical protein